LQDIKNNPQIYWLHVSKFSSTSPSEGNSIDLGSWESDFFSLFSDNPHPLGTTFRFIILGHFAKLDHAKNYIIIMPEHIQAIILLFNQITDRVQMACKPHI